MSTLWIQTIALILTPTGVIVVLGFLGRSAVNQFLSRSLEQHKAALAMTTARETETLKVELRQLAYEHEVIFGKLHANRAEALKTLYDRARTLAEAARSFASDEDVRTDDDFERNRKTLEDALNTFRDSLLENRIFLSEDLCVKIDELSQELLEPARDIAGSYLFLWRSPAKRLEARLTDKRKLEDATWRLETEIAAEFRKLLGVK